MKNKAVSVFLIILLATLCKSQKEFSLQSQQNEVRNVNLFEEFGIATGNYQITSPTASVYQIDQPLDIQQDNNFFAAPRYLVSSSYLVINSQTTQQIQIYNDLSKPLDEQDQKYLSLVQIQSINGQTQITELAQLNLSTKLNAAYSFEAALFAQSQGILLYQVGQNAQQNTLVSLITLDASNNIVLSTPVQLEQASINLQANFGVISNKVYFIVQEKASNIIHLRQFDLTTKSQQDLSQYQACSFLINPNIVYIPNTSGYLIQCNKLNKNINYSYYYIDTNLNILAEIISDQYIDYSIRTIKSVTTYNNQIYIITTTQLVYNNINLFVLSINKNSIEIDMQIANIKIPINNIDLFGSFITDQGLITLVTQTQIIGISLQDYQIAFNIKNQPIQNNEVFTANIYGNQIAIQYNLVNSNAPTFTTKIITPGIPKLSITQISDQTQIYTLNYDNDVLKRTMTVTANLIASDSNLVILKNLDVNISSVLPENTSRVQIDMEQYLIGFIQSASFSTNFYTPQITTYTQLFKQDYKPLVTNIYSTSNSFILVETENQPYRGIITLSLPFVDQSQIFSLATITPAQAIISVDQSGFFSTLNDSAGQYKQIYIFQNKGAQDFNYQFNIIPQVCESIYNFLFTGDSINSQVIVLCDKVLTLYQFNQQNAKTVQFTFSTSLINYQDDKFTQNIVSIELRSNSILYLTDLSIIMAIDISRNFVIGQVKIPANALGQFVGKVLFFYDTFILARNDINPPIITQYSYNSFDGSTATPLRTLLTFNYKWNLKTFFSGISSIKNNSNENQDEEFLIINADNDAYTIYKLFYRISKIQAQNQLLTYLAIDPNTPFYAIPNQIGYIVQNNLLVFQLNYNSLITLGFDIPIETFQEQISGQKSGQVTVNGQYTFNLKYNYQRNVDTSNGEILNNDSVQQFKALFENIKVVTPFTCYFNDKQFTNSHLLGWQEYNYDNNFDFSMSFNQRVSNMNNFKLPSTIASLEVMPNVIIYATDQAIFIEGNTITNTLKGSCQFYKDDGKLDITNADGQSIIKQVVYSVIKDLSTPQKIILSQYTVQGTYGKYPNSQPKLKLLSYTGYAPNSSVLQTHNIIRIQQDETLGLLALIQENGVSQSTQVCQLKLDQANSKFSFDCDIYQSISNLFIANIVYISSANQNVFVTFTDQIYYGFSADLTTFTQFNFKQLIILQGKQLNPASTLKYAIKISDSKILVSYAGDNIFILQLYFASNKINVSNGITTLYQQSGLNFIGSVLLVSDTQLLLLFQNIEQTQIYFLSLYEQFNDRNDEYLIRSAYFFMSDVQVLSSTIYFYSSQYLLSLTYSNNALTKPTALQITDNPAIKIETLSFTFKSKDTIIPPFKFAIAPFYQSNINNILSLTTTVTQSTGGSVSKSCILVFAISLITFILFMI